MRRVNDTDNCGRTLKVRTPPLGSRSWITHWTNVENYTAKKAAFILMLGVWFNVYAILFQDILYKNEGCAIINVKFMVI